MKALGLGKVYAQRHALAGLRDQLLGLPSGAAASGGQQQPQLQWGLAHEANSRMLLLTELAGRQLSGTDSQPFKDASCIRLHEQGFAVISQERLLEQYPQLQGRLLPPLGASPDDVLRVVRFDSAWTLQALLWVSRIWAKYWAPSVQLPPADFASELGKADYEAFLEKTAQRCQMEPAAQLKSIKGISQHPFL